MAEHGHEDKDRTRARAMRAVQKYNERRERDLEKRARVRAGEAEQSSAERRRDRRRQRRRAKRHVDLVDAGDAPRDDDADYAPPSRPRRVPKEQQAAPANATVLSITAGRADVWHDGRVVTAELGDALRRTQQHALAVGDDVHVATRSDGSLRLTRVAPRRSTLSRPDPAQPRRQRVLVANVDAAVVVLSLWQPALRASLVDRILVALEQGGVRPVLCVNKTDLLPPDDSRRAAAERRLQPYRDLDVALHWTSAHTGDGVAALRAEIAGQTVAFVGHSGVGKSALLNCIDPDRTRSTDAGRAFDGKGRHTTRGATLAALPDGTRIIDTAGIREFGLWDVDASALQAAFPELAEVAPRCRFRGCRHLAEPDCAVRAAIATGGIARARYDAYARLAAEARD